MNLKNKLWTVAAGTLLLTGMLANVRMRRETDKARVYGIKN
jgi:hypothetical protein